MTTSQCKSCGAPIVWIVTPAGKNMPLDAKTETLAMRAIRDVRVHLEDRLDRIEAEQRKNEPTLRDRFAMAALTGAMPAFFEEGSSWEDYDDMAGTCYQVADAMLRARGK